MKIAIIKLLSVLAFAAFASEARSDWSNEFWPAEPPAHYNHEPVVPVKRVTLPQNKIKAGCAAAGIRFDIGYKPWACARLDAAGCLMLLPPDDGTEWWRELYRHERAYCNGWQQPAHRQRSLPKLTIFSSF